MRIVVTNWSRWERTKRVVRGTLGWVSFIGIFAVVGSIESEVMDLGIAFAAIIPLFSVMWWSIHRFVEDNGYAPQELPKPSRRR